MYSQLKTVKLIIIDRMYNIMRLKVTLLLGLLIISCSPKELPTIVSMDTNKIEVKLSHQTSRSEIESVQKILKENYNTELDMSKSTFFEDGKIRDLALQVRASDGTGGTVNAMLSSLQYVYAGFELNVIGDSSTSALSFGNYGVPEE